MTESQKNTTNMSTNSFDVPEDPNLCLIGKFFTTSSPPSIHEIETTLRQQEDYLSGDMTVSSFGKDLFLFEFELETDMNLVLHQTWNVNGVNLVLKEWPTHVSLSDIDFSVAWFCVKVEGLPLSRYTEEEARRIGERLSDKPLHKFRIDSPTRNFFVRAEIDLKKPLNPGFFIDKQQKSSYVQFKYLNLGWFCSCCGKIDHVNCQKIPEKRPLYGEFLTPLYGPWLWWNDHHDQELLVEFPERTSEKTQDEETVPYEQFFIKLKVEVVYANEYNWEGKTLNRSISAAVHEHRFRFPISFLATTLEFNDLSEAYKVLAREIEEKVPLMGLTFEDKLNIVERFVEYSKNNIENWSDRTWVPVRICVKKTIKPSCVDFQTKLQDHEDKEFTQTVGDKITEMLRRCVENNEDVLSVPLWERRIRDLLEQMGITEIPFDLDLARLALESRTLAIEHGIEFFKGPVPAEEASVQGLERVKVLGQDMDSLDPCAICQEGMFLGDEATRMPCSHLLHTVCIEQWLQKGNQCPLCRFQLPSQERVVCPEAYDRCERLKQEYL